MRHLLALLMLSSVTLSGCLNMPQAQATQSTSTSVKAQKTETKQAEIKQADVEEAYQLLKTNPKLQFLDVRNPDEYAAGHAVGTQLMPLPNLSTWAAKLDKKAVYVIICRSGSRSMMASQQLVQLGFTDVTNVKGGTNAWDAAGLPMQK